MQERVAEVTKIAAPKTDHIRMADGPETPADGVPGFCKGCLFINTTDGKHYVNGGDEKACAFSEK
jgi:hypothetical protein